MPTRLLEDFSGITPDWFWEMDENLRFTFFSSGLETTVGVSPESEIGKSRIEIAANAVNAEFWQPHIDDLKARRPFRDFEYPYKRRDGRTIWLRISGDPVYDSDGVFKGYRGVGSNVTTEHEAREQLAEANARLAEQNLRFEAAIENMPVGLSMFDGDRRLIICNNKYIEMYGLSEELAKSGTLLDDILADRITSGNAPGPDTGTYLRELAEMIERAVPTQQTIELRNGSIYSVSHMPMADGGWVATHEDITARRRADERIAYMARHDALTGLPNRLMFRERMEQALERARDGEMFAVLCLDLDNFKGVNDLLGHPAGDTLLRAVTRRLLICLREEDLVARLGGDEFAILQMGIAGPEAAAALAGRIIELLNAAFTIDGHQVVIGTSIGISLAPAHGLEADKLLKNADLALYRAKDRGRRNFRFFEPAMDAELQARRALEVDLRQALVAGEFELFYQPIVNVASGRVSGLEALVRWRHPERGLQMPGTFVPLCEEIGLIGPLGEWVLREACMQVADLSGDLAVAVNLSPVQFCGSRIVGLTMEALIAANLDPRRLELEITESVLLLESEETLDALHKLRDLGVRISMDDFGTGYSSLSYLRRFPFDRIKIDRSFIADLGTTHDSRAIIRAIATLAADLGIPTTAEGVETMDQLEVLLAEGLTEVQGYLFSRPLPLSEIETLLRKAAFVAA